jgi:hypothetical protein
MKFDTLRWSRDWSRFKFFSILRPEKNTEIKSHTASASVLGFSARTFLIMSSRAGCNSIADLINQVLAAAKP